MMENLKAQILKELEGLNQAQTKADQHKSKLSSLYIQLAARDLKSRDFIGLAHAAVDAW